MEVGGEGHDNVIHDNESSNPSPTITDLVAVDVDDKRRSSVWPEYLVDARGIGPILEQPRRRMDPSTNEPLFTNCTRDFIGTHDYIFYTADSLMVESLLELLDEDGLKKDTALPSPKWSSDHIALLAEFRCKPRNRR